MRQILLLSLVAAAACGPGRSELVVDWTFESKPCSEVGVATIRVDVANEVLSRNEFTCQEAGLGVDLGSYLSGHYQITVTGFDALGAVTHQTIVTLAVGGGGQSTYTIDVPRVAPSTVASANLTWTFDGKSCALANVEKVTILVDPNADGTGGTDAGTVACSTMGTDGAFVEPLTGGVHTFAILGLNTVGSAVRLAYRTHRPPAYFFQAGLITDVKVSAESPP
jgi:hypothetical protein